MKKKITGKEARYILRQHADKAIRKILDNMKNLPILTDGQEKT